MKSFRCLKVSQPPCATEEQNKIPQFKSMYEV